MQAVPSRPYFDTSSANQVGSLHQNRSGALGVTASRLLRFALHFAEMWFAMVLGSMAFAYTRHWLAIVGDRSFLDPASLPSEIGHGIFMTAPMVLWMRIRRYRWCENIEMALGMIVPWAAVIAGARFNVLQRLPWLSARNAMAGGMLAVMLYHTWANRPGSIRKGKR